MSVPTPAMTPLASAIELAVEALERCEATRNDMGGDWNLGTGKLRRGDLDLVIGLARKSVAGEGVRELAIEALTEAEDVLSRSPFSTELLPNGTHPNACIERIREALTALKSINPAAKGEVEQLRTALRDTIASLEITLKWGEGWECSEDELLGEARLALSSPAPQPQQGYGEVNPPAISPDNLWRNNPRAADRLQKWVEGNGQYNGLFAIQVDVDALLNASSSIVGSGGEGLSSLPPTQVAEGWRPIDAGTPPDIQLLLGWADKGAINKGKINASWFYPPTHWMPLPLPPPPTSCEWAGE